MHMVRIMQILYSKKDGDCAWFFAIWTVASSVDFASSNPSFASSRVVSDVFSLYRKLVFTSQVRRSIRKLKPSFASSRAVSDFFSISQIHSFTSQVRQLFASSKPSSQVQGTFPSFLSIANSFVHFASSQVKFANSNPSFASSRAVSDVFLHIATFIRVRRKFTIKRQKTSRPRARGFMYSY